MNPKALVGKVKSFLVLAWAPGATRAGETGHGTRAKPTPATHKG